MHLFAEETCLRQRILCSKWRLLYHLHLKDFCSECKRITEYECLNCSVAICNECSTFEENEDVPGWQMGKTVGYCANCYLDKGSDNKINESLEDTESSFDKSTDDKGKYLIF